MAVKKRQKPLSHGRPPVARGEEHMSSKQTRTIIRTHHRLQKEHAAAVKRGDLKTADEIQERLQKNGGLKLYQVASKLGQSKARGGDSSSVLVEWLQQSNIIKAKKEPPNTPYRLLEVGALSTENEISKYPKIIHITRIDLNSQGPGIEQQDFMERPLPTSREEMFDIISLSLVLNYVPDPVGRGEMLKRITRFLRQQECSAEGNTATLPALFLVLPLPCVANSRYLDEHALLGVMLNLGFTLAKKKDTLKLCHYLFTFTAKGNDRKFQKRLIRDGPGMNNFCIVVD
jgi:25S rRNA (adenine2142-N1)-methyltransferase